MASTVTTPRSSLRHRELRRLRPPRPPGDSVSQPPSPSTPSPPSSPSDSPDRLSPEDLDYDDDDDHSVVRPSLYRHPPIPRRAPLEQYYVGAQHRIRLLDELKTDHFEGVYNLSFLLLFFALAYLVARSIVESGFLAGPSAISFSLFFRDLRYFTLFLLPLPLCFLVSYYLILLHVQNTLSTRSVSLAHSVSLSALLVIATASLFRIAMNPILGVASGLAVMVVALKMHSFVATNLLLAEETAQRRRKSRRNEVRTRHRSAPPSRGSIHSHRSTTPLQKAQTSSPESDTVTGVVYPRNVTLRNVAYFIVAPTLVYETGYPRTQRVRTTYLLRHGSQAVVCLLVQYFLLMQFCVPIWKTSLPTDRLLWFSIKLALPCFFMWLLMFWGFFHCSLNMIAELTRFADRQFYREWWNATDLSEFWRSWNIPVHEWCIRHLYVETVRRRQMNAKAAVLGTFVLSALFHEYVCVVGFRMLRPYMFAGMMLQVPLIKWSCRLSGSRKGNFFMWIMLFLGQSWVSLLYCRDYVLSTGTLM